MLEYGLLGILQHVLQVPGQLLVFEQFLCVVVLLPQPLVFDAVDDREPLASVDRFRRDLDLFSSRMVRK